MEEQQALRQQLARLEERLAVLERVLGVTPATAAPPAPPPASTPTAAPAAPAPVAAKPATPQQPAADRRDDGGMASRWMAWGAAFAFLLASVYLLRIVYDSGWLTPPRQLGLATLGGSALIATGLFISRIDRAYAAYLPAAGIVVLYLSAWAAHLYYQLVDRDVALAAVAVLGISALWLGRQFSHSVFAVLATLATYLFPLALTGKGIAVGDLVVYYAAWGLVFAFAALVEGRRTPYVLSMFFALVSFQVAWRLDGSEADWVGVAVFQCFQFVLSALTAVAFSIRHRQPMDSATALVHGIALFYFYLLEYALLRSYVPEQAGLYALGSAVFVLVAYLVARNRLPAAQRGAGAFLASSYCAAVTAHILAFDWLPVAWLPWAALLAPLAGLALAPAFRDTPQALLPIRVVAGIVFAVGLLVAVINDPAQPVPLPEGILFAYAAALYLGYTLARRLGDRGSEGTNIALLYAGHVSAMLAASRALDSGFTISLAWAILAIAVLLLALRYRNRDLGRSSLLVFAVSAGKVLLLDLDGSNSVLRVLSLVVVGISLYAGGWLYQRMFRDSSTHPPGNTP